MDAGQDFRLDALGDQIVEYDTNLALAANHADVAARRPGEVIERLFIVIVAPGHNEGVVVGRQRGNHFLKRRTDTADEKALGGGEAVAAGEAFAVVENP